MLVFSTQLCELLPLYPSLWFNSPPPLPCVKVQYIRLRLGGGGGFWVLLEIMFCRSLTFCIWPDSEPTKLLDYPKQKPRRGGGLRQINTCRPFTCKFFRWRHFALLSISLIFLRSHPRLQMNTLWSARMVTGKLMPANFHASQLVTTGGRLSRESST